MSRRSSTISGVHGTPRDQLLSAESTIAIDVDVPSQNNSPAGTGTGRGRGGAGWSDLSGEPSPQGHRNRSPGQRGAINPPGSMSGRASIVSNASDAQRLPPSINVLQSPGRSTRSPGSHGPSALRGHKSGSPRKHKSPGGRKARVGGDPGSDPADPVSPLGSPGASVKQHDLQRSESTRSQPPHHPSSQSPHSKDSFPETPQNGRDGDEQQGLASAQTEAIFNAVMTATPTPTAAVSPHGIGVSPSRGGCGSASPRSRSAGKKSAEEIAAMGQELEQLLNDSPNSLNLFMHGLALGQVGANRLQAHIESHPRLTMVELRGSSIGNQGASYLAAAFRYHPCLSHLGLARNGIDTSAAVKVIQSLKDSPIRSLDLEGNMLGDAAAKAMAELLRFDSCCLVAVTLERNGIRHEGASALAQALLTNSKLRNLNLAFNRIGNKGAVQFGEAIGVNKSLLTLNIASNEIGGEGGRAIADGLCMNSVLRALNLQGNQVFTAFGERGANLTYSESLMELNLYGNTVPTAASAKGFADSLQGARNMAALSLAHSSSGDESMSSILNGITFMAGLISLDLTRCVLSSVSAQGIADVLNSCIRLATLRLDDNRIDPQGMTTIAPGLARAAALTELSLSGCALKAKGARTLGEALAQRHGLPLRDLRVARNMMDTSGVSILCSTLPEDGGLVHLDLSENGIAVRTATPIFKLASTMPMLKTVVIRGNPLAAVMGQSYVDTPSLRTFVAENFDPSQAQGQPGDDNVDANGQLMVDPPPASGETLSARRSKNATGGGNAGGMQLDVSDDTLLMVAPQMHVSSPGGSRIPNISVPSPAHHQTKKVTLQQAAAAAAGVPSGRTTPSQGHHPGGHHQGHGTHMHGSHHDGFNRPSAAQSHASLSASPGAAGAGRVGAGVLRSNFNTTTETWQRSVPSQSHVGPGTSASVARVRDGLTAPGLMEVLKLAPSSDHIAQPAVDRRLIAQQSQHHPPSHATAQSSFSHTHTRPEASTYAQSGLRYAAHGGSQSGLGFGGLDVTPIDMDNSYSTVNVPPAGAGGAGTPLRQQSGYLAHGGGGGGVGSTPDRRPQSLIQRLGETPQRGASPAPSGLAHGGLPPIGSPTPYAQSGGPGGVGSTYMSPVSEGVVSPGRRPGALGARPGSPGQRWPRRQKDGSNGGSPANGAAAAAPSPEGGKKTAVVSIHASPSHARTPVSKKYAVPEEHDDDVDTDDEAGGVVGLAPGAPTPFSQRRVELHDVEANVGDLCFSDLQLRFKFQEWDEECNGYLTAEEFMRRYTASEVVPLPSDEKRARALVDKYCKGDGKIQYDEFCIMMLQLVSR